VKEDLFRVIRCGLFKASVVCQTSSGDIIPRLHVFIVNDQQAAGADERETQIAVIEQGMGC
jgi:hypothetical protein